MVGMADCLKESRVSEDTTSGGSKRVLESISSWNKKVCKGHEYWIVVADSFPCAIY